MECVRKPLILILGRPNVGKSTLFNRLVGEKKAIVEDIPGTTRDLLFGDVKWKDREYTIVDSGGLEIEPSTSLGRKIKSKIEEAVREADLVLFMTDVKDGLTIPDQEAADFLRRLGKPVLLVVNKVDNEKRALQVSEFFKLGLGEPIPISAYHGKGIEEMMDKVAEILPSPPPSEEEEEEGLKLIIMGRPNVGKSMLLNAILKDERVLVDETPGTTRDPVDVKFEFGGEPFILIDTAGLRRKGRIEAGIESYSVLRALRALERSDVAALVLDATEGITAQDLHIAGYILEAEKGLVIAVNKWDLVENRKEAERWYKAEAEARFRFAPSPPLLFTSALKGWGVEKLLRAAREVYRNRTRRIPQPALDRAIREIVAAYHPPSVGGKSGFIFGLKQVGISPPSFELSVNNPDLFPDHYIRYIENRLRERFELYGTPLRLILKRKR